MPSLREVHAQTLIIGGGATGAGLARDLTLRGVSTVLVERAEFTAGASGANHGLLHSGGRYVSSDPVAARECAQESDIIKRLAPSCVEECGGYFIALPGDDERYVADFPARCAAAGVDCRAVDVKEAREAEPAINPDTVAVYAVPDGMVNPFKLTMDNLAEAETRGARVMNRTRVVEILRRGRRVEAVKAVTSAGVNILVRADQIVNAAGAWSGVVAGMAGVELPVVFSKGTLLVTNSRLCHRVVNRLRRPGDGDIIVPAAASRCWAPPRAGPTTRTASASPSRRWTSWWPRGPSSRPAWPPPGSSAPSPG